MAYTYVRPNELAAWLAKDVEIDVGVIKISKAWNFVKDEPKDYPKSKAGVRDVPIEPSLVPLMRLLLDGLGPDERVFTNYPNKDKWAELLRDDLERAGVSRAALFEDTPTVKQITLYDLRASGITWRTLRGDEPRVIQQEAGHEKYATTEGYVRAARLYRGKVGEPFPTLPPDVVDPSAVSRFRSPNRSAIANRAKLSCRRRESNPHDLAVAWT